MENQTNIGDQNTQHVGQNPVSQPAQIPEKPKINYGIISMIVLFILLLIAGGAFYLLKSQRNQSSQQIENSITPAQPSGKTGTKISDTNKKVIYSVQEDSSNDHHTLYATDLTGAKVKLLEYQGGYTSSSPIPQVSSTGIIVFLDGRNKLFSVDLQGNKKLLTQTTQGYELLTSVISDDGKTVLYQEFESGESGQSCKSFKLWKIDTETGKKGSLYSSSTNYLQPIKISADNKKAFILRGSLAGGEASCYGVANILQTVDLTSTALTTIKTFRLSSNHPFTIELGNGILISPDEKYGIIAYSTNPASPLISTPSKQYPVKGAAIDLSNGSEMPLTESTDRYIFPIGWYSNSKTVLYREVAPDTAENYQDIQDVYKSIDIQLKQSTQLFTLERRSSGIEYDRLVDDSTLVYSHRMLRNKADEPFSDTTTLYKINLDGTNKVELDKQSRFLYLIGIASK